MAVMYSTKGISTGMGRDGAAAIEDSDLKLTMTPPGGKGDGTNPEQLFAMGYAACFHSALKAVGSSQSLSTKDSTVATTVDLFKNDDGTYSLGVKIEVELPALDREEAQGLVETAHQVCPYSGATRGNIPVEVSVV